jgi:hypothetical protein
VAIRLRMPVPASWRHGRCRQLQVTSWADDPPFDRDQQDDMITFCNEPSPCPIRSDCLLFALSNNCADGVWGGMSPRDRRALRRKYPAPPGSRDEHGILRYAPNPAWQWMPPGAAAALLPAREQARLDTPAAGDDDDDDDDG